jgi:Mg/Co/Ni transporter MgtE
VDLASELAARLEAKNYRAAKALLEEGGTEPLALSWPRLPLFERLIAYKLLDAEAAWRFFEGLGYEDRFALFTGFDPGSVAPALDSLAESDRALFRIDPEEVRERMAGTLAP